MSKLIALKKNLTVTTALPYTLGEIRLVSEDQVNHSLSRVFIYYLYLFMFFEMGLSVCSPQNDPELGIPLFHSPHSLGD